MILSPRPGASSAVASSSAIPGFLPVAAHSATGLAPGMMRRPRPRRARRRYRRRDTDDLYPLLGRLRVIAEVRNGV